MQKLIHVGMISIPEPPPVVHLWLDDERPMPQGYNYHCKNYPEARALIELTTNGVSRLVDGGFKMVRPCVLRSMSLDHDLGEKGWGSGYDIACMVEKAAMNGTLGRVEWQVHSMNPVGRTRMIIALGKAEEYWKKMEAENGGEEGSGEEAKGQG